MEKEYIRKINARETKCNAKNQDELWNKEITEQNTQSYFHFWASLPFFNVKECFILNFASEIQVHAPFVLGNIVSYCLQQKNQTSYQELTVDFKISMDTPMDTWWKKYYFQFIGVREKWENAGISLCLATELGQKGNVKE